MQSKKIIFGISTIILLLFSFPKSYCFRNDICSQKNSNLSLNCEDRKNQNIYHQYEEHLDNSNQQFDVRKVRQLQIRSINNDRDLSSKNQIRSRVEDRLIERGHSYIRDRDLSIQNREIRLLNNEQSSRNSPSRLQIRERRSSSRDTERSSSRRNVRENNNDNSRFRERLTPHNEPTTTERRSSRVSERFRVNNIQLNDRVQNFRIRNRESHNRILDRNFSERDSNNQDSRLSEIQNSRERKSIERESRNSERRLVRDARHSELPVKSNNRNTERTRQINERTPTQFYIDREMRTDRRVLEKATRLPEKFRTNKIRDVEQRFVDRISNDKTRLSREQDLPSVERIREFREERDRISPERVIRISAQIRNSQIPSSRRFIENIAISERTRNHRDRVQEREQVSPGRIPRIFEQRSSFRNSLNQRSRDNLENNSVSGRIRESRDRIQERERIVPQELTRVSERRISNSRSSRRSLPTFERSKEFYDRVHENERTSVERMSGAVERRTSNIRSSQRSLPAFERSREFRDRIQEDGRISRVSERRIDDRVINIRNHQRLVKDISLSERTRESRNQLHERIIPEKITRVLERRSTNRDFNIRSSRRLIDDIPHSERTRDSRESRQEREQTTPIRETRFFERRSIDRVFVTRNSRQSTDKKSHNLNQEQERTSLERDSQMNNIRAIDRVREFNNERRFNIREIRDLERRTRQNIRQSVSLKIRNVRDTRDQLPSVLEDRRNFEREIRISRSVDNRDSRLLERTSYQRNNLERGVTENMRTSDRRLATRSISIRNLRLAERSRQSERRDSSNSKKRNMNSHQQLLSEDNDKKDRRFNIRVIDARQIHHSFQNHDQQDRITANYRNSRDNTIADKRNEIKDSRRSVENTNYRKQHSPLDRSSNREKQYHERYFNREQLSESERRYRNQQNSFLHHRVTTENRDARDDNQRISNRNSHQILERSIENENGLAFTTRSSERLIATDRIMNELNTQRHNLIRSSERLADKTRSKFNQKISNRRHGKQNGFRYIFDQRDISVFRNYPTNKVQEINVENQNLWINVVKIFLACLLFLQISWNKTADIKILKSIKIPIISQLIKEKMQ